MSKQNATVEITDLDRTMNYIQFQISQADEMLLPFAGTDTHKGRYWHILEWKKKLQSELSEVRKTKRK